MLVEVFTEKSKSLAMFRFRFVRVMPLGMLHLSFYKFIQISEPSALRDRLKTLAVQLGLRGTILVAGEGLNGSITGQPMAVNQMRDVLVGLGVQPSDFKEAEVSEHAFTRMLVKVKKEIISMGDPSIRPHEKTGARVAPAELKRWLDEGKPIVLLDTRNDYEVEVGTFRGAINPAIPTFTAFPKKAADLAAELKGKTVVSFCTGGIRCEKASAVLMKLGLEDVYQLDGGILRYFEENGSAHFDGSCFVFDWRGAVNGKLEPVARSPGVQYGRHLLKNEV